jgi:hypothetical protein
MATVLEAKRGTTRSARPDELPGFFRHHGVLSPGIRLFRSVGFPTKAAWVSLAFLAPISIVLFALVSTSFGELSGGEVVDHAVETMSGIEASSGRIANK